VIVSRVRSHGTAASSCSCCSTQTRRPASSPAGDSSAMGDISAMGGHAARSHPGARQRPSCQQRCVCRLPSSDGHSSSAATGHGENHLTRCAVDGPTWARTKGTASMPRLAPLPEHRLRPSVSDRPTLDGQVRATSEPGSEWSPSVGTQRAPPNRQGSLLAERQRL
jgi:hypothetical protein